MFLPTLATMAALQTGPGHPLQCQRTTISENSGNGPNYRVTVCTALRELDDQRWNLIVDGSPLQNGAIIIGEKVPA